MCRGILEFNDLARLSISALKILREYRIDACH
jgi:hypothetical protein